MVTEQGCDSGINSTWRQGSGMSLLTCLYGDTWLIHWLITWIVPRSHKFSFIMFSCSPVWNNFAYSYCSDDSVFEIDYFVKLWQSSDTPLFHFFPVCWRSMWDALSEDEDSLCRIRHYRLCFQVFTCWRCEDNVSASFVYRKTLHICFSPSDTKVALLLAYFVYIGLNYRGTAPPLKSSVLAFSQVGSSLSLCSQPVFQHSIHLLYLTAHLILSLFYSSLIWYILPTVPPPSTSPCSYTGEWIEKRPL